MTYALSAPTVKSLLQQVVSERDVVVASSFTNFRPGACTRSNHLSKPINKTLPDGARRQAAELRHTEVPALLRVSSTVVGPNSVARHLPPADVKPSLFIASPSD